MMLNLHIIVCHNGAGFWLRILHSWLRFFHMGRYPFLTGLTPPRTGPRRRDLRFTTTPFMTGFPLRYNRQNTQENSLHIGISNSYGRKKHEFRQDSQDRQDYFLPLNNNTSFTHFSPKHFWVTPPPPHSAFTHFRSRLFWVNTSDII